MGFTRYWRRPVGELIARATWDAFRADVQRIVFARAPLVRGVKINTLCIQFDGVACDNCETFYLGRRAPGGGAEGGARSYEWCKTNRGRYDEVVAAVLCAAKAHLGDGIRLAGGRWEAEWLRGVGPGAESGVALWREVGDPDLVVLEALGGWIRGDLASEAWA